MEKGKRRQFINLVKDKLESKPFFDAVYLRIPDQAVPSSLNLPSVFLYRSTENLTRLTNIEKRSSFGFEMIIYVQASVDIELVKCDAEDIAEEAILELQTDSSFTNLSGVEILVTGCDLSPLALASIGVLGAVASPYGAIRMICEIVFDYRAID